MRFQILIPVLALVLSPLTAVAQESLDATELEQASAGQAAINLPTETDTPSVVDALRPSSASAALLVAPPAANLPTGGDLFEAQRPDDDYTPAALVAPAKGSGTGLGFMIGGAAALVGGLLIGGTGGSIIAAGGVALGVYGAIVYF
jgi:hypothetical protein